MQRRWLIYEPNEKQNIATTYQLILIDTRLLTKKKVFDKIIYYIMLYNTQNYINCKQNTYVNNTGIYLVFLR